MVMGSTCCIVDVIIHKLEMIIFSFYSSTFSLNLLAPFIYLLHTCYIVNVIIHKLKMIFNFQLCSPLISFLKNQYTKHNTDIKQDIHTQTI